MRERAPLLVLVAAACACLASLYLPWQTGANGTCGPGCVEPAFTVDGWSSGLGDVAALAGLALASAAAAALVRPRWSRRVPLVRCGLAVAYLTLALGVAIRSLLRLTSGHPPVHWAYGSYLGVVSAGLSVCVVALIRRRDVLRRPSASTFVFALLGLGLLASFLLPWYRSRQTGHVLYGQPEILFPTAVLAALVIAFAGTDDRRRPGSAAAAALFTGAAFASSTSAASRAYGAWLGLAFALALVVFATLTARETLRRPALTGGAWAVAGAVSVFVASLFMHWQTFCAPGGNRCFSLNGWTLPTSTAAVLALLVAAAPVLRQGRTSNAELAVGAGLLVATAGAGIGQLVPSRFGYGAFVGFVATGGFVLLTLGRLRLPPPDHRQLIRLVPVAASALFMLGVLLPWWSVLPSGWESESDVLPGWLAVAGLLFSLHLLASWLARSDGSRAGDETLMLGPFALLALVVLGIIRDRSLGLTWGGGILMALCLLLLALGWLERRQGLEHVRPPELLRLDRLPGAEA